MNTMSITVGSEDHVFVLTGSGISAESGIPTFRATGGLWEGYNVEDVCSPRGWRKDPMKVWDFYFERRKNAIQAEPNAAHFELEELEQRLGDRFFLCTQNVDDLHEKAGSTRIAHMHGELFKSRCEMECSPIVEDKALFPGNYFTCPHCFSLMRPHIVFFQEMPLHLNRIEHELDKATLLVVVGTSGVVYPAAGFVEQANKQGVRTVYVGLERPDNAHHFSEVILGKASEVLKFDVL